MPPIPPIVARETAAPTPARLAARSPARLIVFDIDGTLMPSSGTAMSPRTIAALRAVEASGIEVAIATGRRQAYAVPLLDQVGLRPETVLITSNGTVTRTLAGEPIDRHYLPVETARALCAALKPFGGTTVFTFDKLGRGELVLESLSRLHDRVAAWVEANLPWIEEIAPLERAFDSGEAPIQAMMCGTVQEMKAAESYLAASAFAGLVEMHRTEYADRDLSILDLLPPGCSKGVAVARLAARRGLAAAEVMAVGDNWNDLEMLRWVGQPVLMGNASPELMEIALEENWRVAATNDEDGVAQVLEAVLDPAETQAEAEGVL
jgi:Cof subfamily protein (haloacid dehalogenase superfamily)